MPKIVGYARYYIEKIRILHGGPFARWRNFLRRVGTPRTFHAFRPRIYMDYGIGWTLWDGWHSLDQIGWKSVPVAGIGWIVFLVGMDSWFSYIP